MTPSAASDALIATLTVVPTLLALLHLAHFPYVRSTAIPAWFLVIAVIPVVGPAIWAAYARSRGVAVRRLIDDVIAPR